MLPRGGGGGGLRGSGWAPPLKSSGGGGGGVTSCIATCTEAVARRIGFCSFVFRTHLFRAAWCGRRRRMNNILTDHFLPFTLAESKDVQTDNFAVTFSLFFFAV